MGDLALAIAVLWPETTIYLNSFALPGKKLRQDLGLKTMGRETNENTHVNN